MSVRLTKILDHGDIRKERIVMKASSRSNIGDFLMLRSALNGDVVTTEIDEVFWFPDKEVAAGDTIVLYSKPGTDGIKTNKDKSTSHFFYWSRPEPLWGSKSHAAVLLTSPQWQSLGPD